MRGHSDGESVILANDAMGDWTTWRRRCNRYGDFEVKREWWTGDAVPEVQVVRREIAGSRMSR
jgi:hypothetical protein